MLVNGYNSPDFFTVLKILLQPISSLWSWQSISPSQWKERGMHCSPVEHSHSEYLRQGYLFFANHIPPPRHPKNYIFLLLMIRKYLHTGTLVPFLAPFLYSLPFLTSSFSCSLLFHRFSFTFFSFSHFSFHIYLPSNFHPLIFPQSGGGGEGILSSTFTLNPHTANSNTASCRNLAIPSVELK